MDCCLCIFLYSDMNVCCFDPVILKWCMTLLHIWIKIAFSFAQLPIILTFHRLHTPVTQWCGYKLNQGYLLFFVKVTVVRQTWGSLWWNTFFIVALVAWTTEYHLYEWAMIHFNFLFFLSCDNCFHQNPERYFARAVHKAISPCCRSWVC